MYAMKKVRDCRDENSILRFLWYCRPPRLRGGFETFLNPRSQAFASTFRVRGAIPPRPSGRSHLALLRCITQHHKGERFLPGLKAEVFPRDIR